MIVGLDAGKEISALILHKFNSLKSLHLLTAFCKSAGTVHFSQVMINAVRDSSCHVNKHKEDPAEINTSFTMLSIDKPTPHTVGAGLYAVTMKACLSEASHQSLCGHHLLINKFLTMALCRL